MASNTKGKRFIYYTLGFLVVIVFLVFYFRDTTDTEKIEKAQDTNAEITADTLEDMLNASFEEIEFSEDTLVSDTLN